MRRFFHFLLFLIFFTGFSPVLNGQLQSEGTILGDFRTLSASDMIYMLPPLHPLLKESSLQESRDYYHKALTFAHERSISISSDQQGVWSLEEGFRVWRAHIISPGAVSLGLIFDDFYLADGVRLMVYDPDKSLVKGAYTSINNKSSGVFALGHVPGEEVIIELQVPDELEEYGRLSLGSLSHAFLPVALKGTMDGRFGLAQPCEIDISCQEGENWQLEKEAVVRLHTADLYCTGVMLNNTSYNGDPLLLTAEHCIQEEDDAESAIFVFSYESPECYGEDGSVDMSISGAESLSIGDSIDFSLVRLSTPPPESFDVYYAGWDLTDKASGPSTTIHHPEGDVKKISLDLQDPEATQEQSQIPPQFWDLLSHSFWWIKQWDTGSTEPGSSGSPLFSPDKKVIGVLSFGSARCGDSIGYDAETDRVIYSNKSNVDDYYTRLDVAWDYSADPGLSLKPWLDPGNTGARSIEGLNPGASEEKIFTKGKVFQLWPNPASHSLWFSAPGLREGSCTYRIFDARGALLFESRAELSGPVPVNVEKLSPGLYFLNIKNRMGTESIKFIKAQ